MAREVILLGKGDLAIQIGEWFLASSSYNLTAVVPTMPPPTWAASLPDWARAHGVPVVESGHYRDLPQTKDPAWRPALAFSVYYDRIIRREFIDRCERILNLHNGPLPRYRGVSPINWALKNGEQHHGVTIHEITPGIDDGPIVSQITFSTYPEFDEVGDVYRRALRFGWLLFQETIPMLDSITPRPQDSDRALYYNTEQNALLGDRRYFTRSESSKLAAHGSH
jgi:methionyl-tRNA formyltransferase